jgi:hypothetical protein
MCFVLGAFDGKSVKLYQPFDFVVCYFCLDEKLEKMDYQ